MLSATAAESLPKAWPAAVSERPLTLPAHVVLGRATLGVLWAPRPVSLLLVDPTASVHYGLTDRIELSTPLFVTVEVGDFSPEALFGHAIGAGISALDPFAWPWPPWSAALQWSARGKPWPYGGWRAIGWLESAMQGDGGGYAPGRVDAGFAIALVWEMSERVSLSLGAAVMHHLVDRIAFTPPGTWELHLVGLEPPIAAIHATSWLDVTVRGAAAFRHSAFDRAELRIGVDAWW